MDQHDISGITLEAIAARAQELAPFVVRTPNVEVICPALGRGRLHLKLELFQHTGTFKARGALSNVRAIAPSDQAAGITAASAGNHAIAAAWAARQCGLSAKVVMQNTANPYRVSLAREQATEVVMRDPGAPTFEEAARLASEEGRTFVHPFDGLNTFLGTAGVGLEFIQDIPELDAVVVSVGGGGLISGVAAAVKLSNPACAVYGVEPIGAAGMSRSLVAGQPVTLDSLDTLADSLAPPMALPLGHAMCTKFVDEIVTISDDQICAGMVVLAEDAKLAVEPAAGAAMAGVLGPLRKRLQGKRVGVVVCGANIDTAGFAELATRGQDHVIALRGG